MKSTYQLFDDSLDKLGKVESLVRLTVPNVFTQHGDGFGIGVGVELVSALDKDGL